MNINNFEQFIETKIVDRGSDYYESDMVEGVEQIDQGEFSGVVAGSDDYDVYIQLDNNHNILEKDCTCPYDSGNTCKHEVALLYHIKENKLHKQSASGSDLKVILDGVSDDELRKFVLSHIKRNRKFRDDFTNEFG